MMDERLHVPVLPQQVIELLNPQPGNIVLDCTAGRGGHAALIVPRIAPGGRYIALDVDPDNVAAVNERFRDAPVPVTAMHRNFAQAKDVLAELGLTKVHRLLADLGFSSTQMDDAQRGFSFSRSGPLDMRLDPTLATSAADLVNRLPERELADLIYQLGEERLSRKIARKIVETRRVSPINETTELARIVRGAYGRGADRGNIDPATRTFMALRIAVNGELDVLDQLLADLPDLLAPDGIAAIISFHSLEDRRVKQSFAALRQADRAQVLTRKPVIADDDERNMNPRSRSAKLRAMQLLPETSS